MLRNTIFILMLILALAVAACSGPGAAEPTPQPTTEPEIEEPPLPPAAAIAAQQRLAETLGLATDEVEIVEYEKVEWPDSCLGYQRPDRACAEVITPGYRVILTAGGEEYEVHTDATGANIALPLELDNEGAAGADIPAVQAAITAFAAEMGMAEADIEIESVSEMDWPDSCLGIHDAGVACLDVITPGYQVMVNAGGEAYEIRANLDGTVVRWQFASETGRTYPPTVLNAITFLGKSLNIPTSGIWVTSFEEAEWPDSCLGYSKGSEGCAQVITPGWRVILNTEDGAEYELHTDAEGEAIRLDPESPVAAGSDVTTLAALLDELKAGGAMVEMGDTLEDDLFTVSGAMVTVDGGEVQVFEFADEAEREAVSETIAANGSIIGTIAVDWIAQPHFWAEGRLIVMTIEQDEALRSQLTEVMGKPLFEGAGEGGGFAPGNTGEPLPPAVEAAVATLSDELGVAESAVVVDRYTAVDWPDSCLGFELLGLACLDVIVPGYQVFLTVNGVQYEAHTNVDGSNVMYQAVK